jgi:hypothetical protein
VAGESHFGRHFRKGQAATDCQRKAAIFVGRFTSPPQKSNGKKVERSGGGRFTAIKVRDAGDGSQEVVMFPADHVHPEFGYFCPSPSLRRKARIAFAFIAFGIGALALRAGPDPGGESAMMIARVDESPPGVETISTVGQSTGITAAESSPPREQTACQEDTYFDECGARKMQKRRRVRAANDAPPIAAVALGRSALSPPDASPPPPKSTGAGDEATIAPGATTKQSEAVDEGRTAPEVTTDQPAATPRKVRKASASQNRARHADRVISSWHDERRGGLWNARAYARPNDGYPRYQYARSWSWGSSW